LISTHVITPPGLVLLYSSPGGVVANFSEASCPTSIEAQHELHDKVNRIYQGLYGISGTKENGLCGKFERLQSDYYRFKRQITMILCISAGSGTLAASLMKILGG
jgi:hypothetical protein